MISFFMLMEVIFHLFLLVASFLPAFLDPFHLSFAALRATIIIVSLSSILIASLAFIRIFLSSKKQVRFNFHKDRKIVDYL